MRVGIRGLGFRGFRGSGFGLGLLRVSGCRVWGLGLGVGVQGLGLWGGFGLGGCFKLELQVEGLGFRVWSVSRSLCFARPRGVRVRVLKLASPVVPVALLFGYGSHYKATNGKRVPVF